VSGTSSDEIASSLEAAVRQDRLRPGEALPTIRSLATQLGVSTTTVAASYKELTRRGIIIGEGRRGTRVRSAPPISGRLPIAIPSGALDLFTGGPDPELLPELPQLNSLAMSAQRRYGGPSMSARLRQVAAEHLGAEGIDTQNLAVVGGALDGVERVLGAWLRPGDKVAVEDPGYSAVFDLLAALGLRLVPVDVDELGARPEDLRTALERGVSAVVLTPRAQNPTGAAWDKQRAADLTEVLAKHTDALVVEDDHAGPAAGVSPHTICGASSRWATIRSVSKWLGPDLRVAVLAADQTTVSRVEGRQALGTGWVSFLLQEMVAQLWSDPVTEQILERSSVIYANRRNALIAAFADERIQVAARSGLTMWVPVPDEYAVVAGLLEAGIAVGPGERFRVESAPGVRVAFAALDEREAPSVASAFANVLSRRPVRTG